MGLAVVEGALASGAWAGPIIVAEPDRAKRARFEGMGEPVRVVPTAGECVRAVQQQERTAGAGVLLLAVKPQALAGVGVEVAPRLQGSRLVISMLAGAASAHVREGLGGAVRVVRVMPNTPARVRRGVTAVSPGAGASAADAGVAERLFGALGEIVRVEESQMDAFTAVAGSGPAYVFLLAEAMVRGAVRAGFDEATAARIVRGTVAGAGALLAASPESPAALRGAVTSKGGTTEAALGVLEGRGFAEAVEEAVVAARDRGRALGGG
jgi:pyrroline-5-carboxylate reductase